MPTPVSSARQCLTEEAARALDDAVAVAKRRSHAQTTSLHAVSALLALPSSTLREACSRPRSSAYSPRLQFKALELCVGVSLDRLPTTKSQDEPPISNSLMAAIKRSQANQRRHPETFHLYQQLQYQNNLNGNSSSPPSISTVKVELKHFILSILDDPIVSRVFGEAGFRSFELKITILNPPTISRYPKTRFPPLFLCNLSDLELNKRGFSFPFSGVSGSESLDENSRRIGELLAKKNAKNPLLVGVCANDALNDFTDVVRTGKAGVLHRDIDGLEVACLETDMCEFLAGGRNEVMMGLKFQEVDDLVERCKGAGVVVNFGDLKAFVDGGESVEAVKYVVLQLSRLAEVHCGKLRLIGSAASYDTYMKFLAQFPSIEKDWDLYLVPITSSKPFVSGMPSRSSLMGSFVPFGGFFSVPSDFENSWSNKIQSVVRCNLCNEKYEQEASTILKGGSNVSVAGQYSANLSPWLQISDCEEKKTSSIDETKDDRTLLNARLMAVDTKWNDICQRIHQNWSFQQNVTQARLPFPKAGAFQLASARNESSNRESLFANKILADHNSCMLLDSQKTSPSTLNESKRSTHESCDDSLTGSPAQGVKIGNLQNLPCDSDHLSICHANQMSSSSTISVTTDLGLGTLYASALKDPGEPKIHVYKDRLQNSGSVSSDTSGENTSNNVNQSFSGSMPLLQEPLDTKDIKHIWRVLSEKVSWQDEAVLTLSQTVASCRKGNGRRHGPNKGNIWLNLLGPDKVGKRRIAEALAEALFGSTQSLLRIDLGFLDNNRSSTMIIDREDSRNYDRNLRGKTLVDYIAEELSKKSETVVLLENIDKADVLVQNSLSQAIRTGKFLNSHRKEISVNNKVFVVTSRFWKGRFNFSSGEVYAEYPEERILAAKDLQMQIQVGRASGNGVRIENTNVMITAKKGSTGPLSAGKRKFDDDIESAENRMLQIPKRTCETTRSSFDLNLPVEGMGEESECSSGSDSDSASEGSKAWLEDFLGQMDGNAVLKPFDFEALAQRVLKEVDSRLKKTVESKYLLEIESEIVVQILAAAWLSERKSGVEDWIRQVLHRSLEEAWQKCNFGPRDTTGNVVVKLSSREGRLVEDHCPGICLPARVIVG